MPVEADRDTEDLLMQGASDLLMDTLGPAFVSEARSLLHNLVVPQSKQRSGVIIYSISSCIPQDVKLDEDGFMLSLECTRDTGQRGAEQPKAKKQDIKPRISFGDTVVMRKKEKALSSRQGPLWRHLHRARDAYDRDTPPTNAVAGSLSEKTSADGVSGKLSENQSANHTGSFMPSDRRVQSPNEVEDKDVIGATGSTDTGEDDAAANVAVARFLAAHLPTAVAATHGGEEQRGKGRGTKEMTRSMTFPPAHVLTTKPATEEERKRRSGELSALLRSASYSAEHRDENAMARRTSVTSSDSSINSFRSYDDVTGRAVYTSVGLKDQPDIYPPPTPSMPSVPPAMVTTRADMLRTTQKKSRKYKDERRYVDFIPPIIDKDDDDEEDCFFLKPAEPVPGTAVPVSTVRRQQRAVAAAATTAAASRTETRQVPFIDLFSATPREGQSVIVTELRESTRDASDLWEDSTRPKRSILGAPSFHIPFYDRVLVERTRPSLSYHWSTSDSDAPVDRRMDECVASRNSGGGDISNGSNDDSNLRCLGANDICEAAHQHKLNGKKVRFDTTIPFVPMLGPMCKKTHVIRVKLDMQWQMRCARWKYHANEILTNPLPIINGRGGPLVVECSATLMAKIIVFPGNEQYASIVGTEPSIENLAIHIPNLSLVHAGFQNWYLKPIIADKITLQLETGVSNRFKRGALVYHTGLCVDHMRTVINAVSPYLPKLRAHPQASEWISVLLRLSTEQQRLLYANDVNLSEVEPRALVGILKSKSKVKTTDVHEVESKEQKAHTSDISTATCAP